MAESSVPLLRLGLVVNPLAGIGGAVGLQGDGEGVQRAARELDGKPRGRSDDNIFGGAAKALGDEFAQLAWCTWGGVMGAEVLASAGVSARVLGEPCCSNFGARHTLRS